MPAHFMFEHALSKWAAQTVAMDTKNDVSTTGAQNSVAHQAGRREARDPAVPGGPAHVLLRHRRHPREVIFPDAL